MCEFLNILGKFDYPAINGSHYFSGPLDERNFQMHVHDKLELLFIISANGDYFVEGVVYPIQPGDIFITQMAECHVPRINFHLQNYERVILQFSPECLTETLNSHLLLPFIQRENATLNRYTSKEISTEYICACMDRIFQVSKNGQACVMSYLIPILQEIYNAWEKKREQSQQLSPQLASRIVGYVNQHLFDLTGLDQLEKDLFMNRTHINRIFRSVTGTTVWNYVQIKRLFAAREMIRGGSLTREAAANCGYQDYSAFYRAYKKQFGHSPQDDTAKQT
jgi:AraC-like DNA-binding protein